MEQGILKLGRGGECRRRPSAHASACWIHDHIRKVTLSQKKTKMSETARAVGRQRTTIIMECIGFRPSWSSNVELILRWDVYDQVWGDMKDILLKCYRSRAESGKLRFTAGWQCVILIIIISMAEPAGTDASKHGLYVRMESKRSK